MTAGRGSRFEVNGPGRFHFAFDPDGLRPRRLRRPTMLLAASAALGFRPVALGALASLNPKNRGRAETATARASRRARATPLSVIHVFGVRTFPK